MPEMEFVRLDEAVQEVAVFTDGIENLVLQKAAQVGACAVLRQHVPAGAPVAVAGPRCRRCRALDTYLSSPTINNRTDDDKTLILASRRRA